MRCLAAVVLALALAVAGYLWVREPRDAAAAVERVVPAAEASRPPVELAPPDPERDEARQATSAPLEQPPTASDTGLAPAPARALLVDVVDVAGAPVEGLRVALFDRGDWDAIALSEAISDAEGRAVLAAPDAIVAQRASVPAVGPMGAFDPDHAVAVVLDPLQEEVARLVVPPTGGLDVRVTGARGAVEVRVETRRAAKLGFEPSWADQAVAAGVRRSADGVARFEHVEAARPLLVIVRDVATGATARLEVDGPAPGATRVVEHAFDGDVPLLVGRLVADPSEFADDDWEWTPFDPDGTSFFSSRDLCVDADGAFRLAIDRAFVELLGPRAWCLVQRDGELRAMIPLAGRLVIGEHDVGALDAGPDALLVAGRAIDARGDPWVGLALHATVRRSEGSAELPLTPRAATDGEGRFRLPGRGAAELDWCLVVAGTRHERTQTPFRPGERFVEIVVEGADALVSGRIVVDPDRFEGIDLGEHFVVVARARDGSSTTTRGVAADGSFFVDAADGAFTVAIAALWSGRVIAEWPEALAPAGEGERYPFLAFDLADTARLVTVRTTDPDGAPVPSKAREDESPHEGDRAPHRDPATEHVLLLDRQAHDVRFEAVGWRSVVVEGLADDREVRFEERPIAVTLHWAAAPPFDPAVRVRVFALADADHGGFGAFDPDRLRPALDDQGFARLEVPHAGRYVVNVGIESALGGGMMWSTPGYEPFAIDVQDAGPQHFELPWDPALLLERLARWRAQRER